MKEKNFQTLFSSWVKDNKLEVRTSFGNCSVFELKIEKGRSIRFDRVAEHQEKGLYDAISDGVYHKINDQPFISNNPDKMRFTNKKPFDCFFVSMSSAFVVVLFYIPRKKKEMIFIPISKWLSKKKEFSKVGRLSIKEAELREIGIIKSLS